MVKIILSGLSNSVVAMDSVAYMDETQKGNIIVCGSHGGESAARQLLRFNPGGAIFNDAGKGKDNAGISGLALLNEAGITAATVDAFSARIGDGMDTYESGVISAMNREAALCGITVGMRANEAAKRMLKFEK
ncbi:MAG: hypothetical protein HY786_05110 [Deltaproteobacteria bacterium]|nr:hypothetical protein [Deltaproteobacteria bacterium]